MKKQRFKKVVEWEKEPEGVSISIGILCLIAFLLLAIFTVENISNEGQMFLLSFISTVLLLSGLILLGLGLGKDRKVILEEIK